MSIAMDSQCLMCQLRRNLELVHSLGTEADTMAFARELMQMYLSAPAEVASPWFNPEIARILHRRYGLPIDRCREEKAVSNAFVLERLDAIRDKVRSAPDPVYAGLQFAVLGNYLDFGALQGKVSFEKLEEMLDSALEMDLDRDTYARLCRDLEGGQKLLYLTDNAGEIGFDRVLAEQLQRRFPHLTITFCVRGAVTLNDATRADAQAVGIDFPVIDNGNDIPGTQLDALSPEADAAIHTADAILAKGMANCETLYGCGLNVYYAFLVKCQRFSDLFQKPMFTPMLVGELGNAK